jgi:hypothetical protein
VIGGEGGAGGGDVDDRIGRAGGRRAFRRPEAFHHPVECDAVAGKKALGQIPVFRSDAQPPPVPGEEAGSDVVEVLHGPDVDP